MTIMNFKYLVIVCFVFIATTINAQNSLQEYGYSNDFISLSNGKFNEFFYSDSIIQIGTVYFNIVTNQIVEFAKDSDDKFSLHKGDVSRWLSPDPHAENYFSYSPYNYCINNPIVFIDPDGRDVYFSHEGRFLYDDGQGKNLRIVESDTYKAIRSESRAAAKSEAKAGNLSRSERKGLMADKMSAGLRGNDKNGNANSRVLTISDKEASGTSNTVDYVYGASNAGNGEYGVNMYINTETATIEFGGLQKTGKTGGGFFIESDKGAIIGNLHGHPDSKQRRADGYITSQVGESKEDQDASREINGPVYSVESGNVYRSSSTGFTKYTGGRNASSILRDAIEQKIPSNSPYFD